MCVCVRVCACVCACVCVCLHCTVMRGGVSALTQKHTNTHICARTRTHTHTHAGGFPMILRHRLHCTVVRDSGEGQQENGDRLTEAEAGKEGGHCQQWIDGHSAQGKVRVMVGCVCVWLVCECQKIISALSAMDRRAQRTGQGACGGGVCVCVRVVVGCVCVCV